MKVPRVSSGLLLYRRTSAGLEVLLAHPGGPFWAKKDAGAWSIPKGLVDPDEDLLSAARREFEEETGIRPAGDMHPLGSIRQKAGKIIHAWAVEGDADPGRTTSNAVELEWPPGSGKKQSFPEIDRCAWFVTTAAKDRINAAQIEFIARLEDMLRKP